ncbi:hypothetical protein CEUSTIGMA_g3687.t1 [Chlamydomonas eustigma]|uniref:Uncharacterized protein n=1 Tax=Chlamydomonas eustigma TaxID=1157962 RepID=A0A250WZG9_9CHLO|nr:hypothetical protein CEUSTIGMA_g3687.t1 [Chlamydomonas eustigma]|eukprot:GAX76243.1 hypothetical protein CEUSTIGMA_g3687.t1 [Chlamydomonas eustigma]
MSLSAVKCRLSSFSSCKRAPVSRNVSVRSDGPHVTREFREDANGQLVDTTRSTSDKKIDASLYADQAMAMKKPKSSLSKEMKEKLRQEYKGWGGAENTAMSSNYFLWVILFVGALAVMSHAIGAI